MRDQRRWLVTMERAAVFYRHILSGRPMGDNTKLTGRQGHEKEQATGESDRT
jgi:hypothetical protein